jgi:hypothetical protein
MRELNQTLFKHLFDYCDGELYWKVQQGSQKPGSLVGCSNGIRKVCNINKKQHYLHRVIYCWHHGEFDGHIDHIDGNPLNNRIENLRLATSVQNNHNRRLDKSSSSKVKNVYWSKANNKWGVLISGVFGKRKFFGYYADIDLAELVAIEARSKYHNQFARHN